ncbi:hypothetical protein J437_LFUL007623 [Ladona fulva]|uniref:Uncharacterized protein n=1 Tax=Ladona fulva TaxID=123851 RepID=A0A8K0K5T0_LADFU|nr:hypothetical protein J437_LFUL007623 [Ladona fulva]
MFIPTDKQPMEETEDALSPSSRGFLVMTSGCKIPDLDPMDPAVRKFVEFYANGTRNTTGEEDSDKVPPNCAGKVGPALVESNTTSLYIVTSALEYYNASALEDVNCCYRPFHRVMADPNHYDYSADNNIEYHKLCYPFQEEGSASVGEHEFVRVECRLSSDDTTSPLIYKDFHAFAPVSVAMKRAIESRGNAEMPPLDHRWSILVFGMDAVSRLNFHRQMPRTKKVLEELGAIEFLGYNKVGDNTFPNIVPLMSGMTEDELKKACWPNPQKKLDDCSWLWRQFESKGYLTGLGEDCAWMSTFNYVKVGFLRQPVHFYVRPLVRTSEDEAGHTKRMNAKVCVGPRLSASNIFNYIYKVMNSVSDAAQSFFGLFWVNSLTHDFLNSAGYADEPQVQLLRKIASTGALNRTLLLFLSDHGIRWGSIRETYQGRLEERLPFGFAVIPPSFKERYPSAVANLVRNARKRLTTAFDLHETLKDLLDPEASISSESLARRSKELLKRYGTRGISLFLPIPEGRTCKDAGITPNWCSCHSGEKKIDTEEPMAIAAAGALVDKVNAFLEPYPQCTRRELVAIKSAIISSPPESLLPHPKKKTLQDVSVVVEAAPGGALFEATVRVVPKEDESGLVSLELAVAGTISRINRYGNQSACVDEFHMKLYCFCGS